MRWGNEGPTSRGVGENKEYFSDYATLPSKGARAACPTISAEDPDRESGLYVLRSHKRRERILLYQFVIQQSIRTNVCHR